MSFGDLSVSQAVAKAKLAGATLSYSGVQDIIRSVFDNGQITVLEREDLRQVLIGMPMDGRARRALTNFITHVDQRSATADMVAQKTGNKNQGIKIDIPDPGPFSEYDTDLDKFSHGNFDALYMPGDGDLNIVLKVKYKFEDGVSVGERTAVRAHMYFAVKAWDNAQATLESSMFVLNPVIRIRFILREVNTGEHKVVDVENDSRREWVGMDINIHKNTTVHTLTHELGHVFGNYDEYGGSGIRGWIERRMWWHDNDHLSDSTALMQDGTGWRTRYFDHMQRFVNRHFVKLKAWYGIRI